MSALARSLLTRRTLLAGTAVWLGAASTGFASVVGNGGSLPWEPDAAIPPTVARPGAWTYFTPEEGAAIEALVDRLIPADDLSPGGKDAGVAVFIDRQLSGPYGEARGLYMRPPFQDGPAQFGPQSPQTPAQRYRAALAALDRHCRTAFAGKGFRDIPPDQQDRIITDMEQGRLQLGAVSARAFFELLLQNAKEGFFADPLYGGNRDMVAWKMIGFPGARYDYRDWVERHNERYPHPPVAIVGRPDWSVQAKG